jgi:hypothetical protein
MPDKSLPIPPQTNTEGAYQGKEAEQQIDKLVKEFDMQRDLSAKGMIRVPDLGEMSLSIDGSKESAVQPSASLTDEFRHSI